MEKNLAKTYNPHEFEDRIYEMWEKKGAFRAEVDENKKPFTIVMPPPNITGQLHMGHALDQTLQDVLDLKALKGHSTIAITEDGTSEGRMVGLVTSRDYRVSRHTCTQKSETGVEETSRMEVRHQGNQKVRRSS